MAMGVFMEVMTAREDETKCEIKQAWLGVKSTRLKE